MGDRNRIFLKRVKEGKMQKFQFAYTNLMIFLQSQKTFAQLHECEALTFRNSVTKFIKPN